MFAARGYRQATRPRGELDDAAAGRTQHRVSRRHRGHRAGRAHRTLDTAIERLATAVGDEETVELAATIRADEGAGELIAEAGEQVEGEVKGAVASADDLAIARYDDLTAKEVQAALGDGDGELVQAVRAYERAHKDRVSVMRATERKLAETS